VTFEFRRERLSLLSCARLLSIKQTSQILLRSGRSGGSKIRTGDTMSRHTFRLALVRACARAARLRSLK
jgi:hypothetical protein